MSHELQDVLFEGIANLIIDLCDRIENFVRDERWDKYTNYCTFQPMLPHDTYWLGPKEYIVFLNIKAFVHMCYY